MVQVPFNALYVSKSIYVIYPLIHGEPMKFMQTHCDMVIFSQPRDYSSSSVLNSLELFEDKALRPRKHSLL